MINGYNLFANALWIIGLASVLATVSWSLYAASQTQSSLHSQFDAPGATFVAAIGMMLVMLGLTLRVNPLWMSPIWLILAFGFGYLAWRALQRYRQFHHRQ